VSYHRTIRFADTDAAGVVYFATLLSICHEAYEAALAEAGVDLAVFFSGNFPDRAASESGDRDAARPVIVPIVHAEIDFRHPLHCGDAIAISLDWQPEPADKFTTESEAESNRSDRFDRLGEFSIAYTIDRADIDRTVARARTHHVCIDRETRQRRPIPAELRRCFDSARRSATSETVK